MPEENTRSFAWRAVPSGLHVQLKPLLPKRGGLRPELHGAQGKTFKNFYLIKDKETINR